MRDARTVLEHQTVVVSAGLIQEIGDTAGVAIPAGSQPIAGAGRYLMPGLVDMHVHLGDSMDDLSLLLVNGVTTIRNMWGFQGFELARWLMGTRVFNHLELRDRIRDGAVLGPRVLSSGPALEASGPFSRASSSSQLAQAAERLVRRQAEQGVDFVKNLYSSLSSDTFDGLVRAARASSCRAPAICPTRSASGTPCARRSRRWSTCLVSSIPTIRAWLSMNRRSAKSPGCGRSTECSTAPPSWCRSGWPTPASASASENEAAMRYVSGRVVRGMRMLQNTRAVQILCQAGRSAKPHLPGIYLRVVDGLKRAGARILLGTDKGAPFVVAGFSVHRELEHLARAAITLRGADDSDCQRRRLPAPERRNRDR